MRKTILIITFLANLMGLYAQKEANNWYFGDYAGINFGFGAPIAVLDGQLSTWEGCSSISSSTGALIFYTDGQFVYNKNHQQMPNGSGLMGNESSTQSGLIVPKIGSTTDFYIFTVDAIEHQLIYGLRYSRVDMTLEGGLGDVVPGEKNVLLIAPTDEKVTAVGNNIGSATWVICHKWESNQYYAYQVTSAGVNTIPVVSTVGLFMGGEFEHAKGYIKTSPDGTKLAAAHNTMNTVEIFDFNITTGIISNQILDNTYVTPPGGDPGGPYGIEFSPNSKLLYCSMWKQGRKIYQYDLMAGSPQAILDSKNLVASLGQNEVAFGALQIGPDNRMYIGRWGYAYLSRINYPNLYGTNCTFQADAVHLGGREAAYGLPPFIQSFFQFSVEYFYDPPCFGTPTQFYTSASSDPDSVVWNFGDPLSGGNNTSTLLNPQHFFVDTSMYIFPVKLTAYISGHTKVAFHLIIVHDPPVLNLGNDSTVCTGVPYVIDAGAGYASYLWNTGDTNQTIVAANSGSYWCEVTTEFSCNDRDSINLTILPTYTFVTDTSVCRGEKVFVGSVWQGDPGTYYDSLLTLLGCDSVYVTNLTVKDTFAVIQDRAICEGDSLFAGGGWQKVTGTYYDSLNTILGCDSVIITQLVVGNNFTISTDTTICEGESIFIGGAWQTQAGIYSDTVSSGSGCDSIFITQLSLADTFNIITTASICQGDSIFLGGAWRKVAGNYLDYLQSKIGCDSTVVTSLSIILPVFGNDVATICEGDSIFLGGTWQTQAGIYQNYLPSALGCDSIVSVDLTVIQPVYGSDAMQICQGDSIFLGGTYRKTPGTYTDVLVAATGCDSILSTQLTVNATFFLAKDTSICEGESVYAGGDFQTQPGIYHDYLVTVNGCDSTVRTMLAVVSLPTVYLGNDTILQDGSLLTLDAYYPGASYQWQDGSTDSVYEVTETGYYYVTVFTECGADIDSILVTYGDFYCDPFVPNAFTPDNDGRNDFFRPVFSCEILEYQLFIYNRWGELLFTSKDVGEGWDGTLKGKPAPGETYVWIIQFRSGLYDQVVDKVAKGNVVLLR